jgi:hypothetical protein
MEILYDTFNKSDIEVKVRCFNDMGGSMSFFYECNKVPTTKVNTDFEVVANYGESYNIFDYDKDLIVLIRYGIFVEMKVSCLLKEEEVKDYLCIDIRGNEININTVNEYKNLADTASYYKIKNKQLLREFSHHLKIEDISPSRRSLVEILTRKVKKIFLKHG